MSERKYFPINEGSARAAHDMMSMRDYSEGGTMAEYHAAADKAYDLADKVAEKNRRRRNGLTDWQNATQRKWQNILIKRTALI